MMDAYVDELDASKKKSSTQTKRQSSINTIELMVYVDAVLQSDPTQNGFSVVEYVLGIINLVSGINFIVSILNHFAVAAIVQMARLYRDPTLQHQIDLTLTRLILEGVGVRTCITMPEADFNDACIIQ